MSFLIAVLFALFPFAPQCAVEDGHTQRVCVWDDGTGATVLNADYGAFWVTLGGE